MTIIRKYGVTLCVIALGLIAWQPANADDVTVQSLLNEGYTVAGVTTPPAGGASLFLQKGTALMFCFASEKPGSPTLATLYCKPVK